MALIDFGGEKETVVTRKEFPIAKARKVLKKETIAVIGYGVQGPAQALNLKDNGFNVIIGQAPEFKRDWDRAVRDGWVPGKTLFDIETAVKKGTIIQMLVSDAAQRAISASAAGSTSIFSLANSSDRISAIIPLSAGSSCSGLSTGFGDSVWYLFTLCFPQ